QLPALTIMVSSLAWALQRAKRNYAVEPAIALMVLAGFYKHNLVATPITVLVWIGLKDWRRGLRASIVGALVAGAGLGLCVAVYGNAFIQQLLFPRDYSLWRSLVSVRELHGIAAAMFIWAIWAWYDRSNRAPRFTILYVAIALVAFFLQKI